MEPYNRPLMLSKFDSLALRGNNLADIHWRWCNQIIGLYRYGFGGRKLAIQGACSIIREGFAEARIRAGVSITG